MNKNVIRIIIRIAAIWILSICFIRFAVVVRVLLYGIALLVAVGTMPLCKKRETQWLFVLNIPAGIPLNICMVIQLMRSDWLEAGVPIIGDIVRGVILYLVLLSIEQIVMAAVSRMIWKEQIQGNMG